MTSGTSTTRGGPRDARNASGGARRRRGLARLALLPLLALPGVGAPVAQTSGEAALTGGERWGADYFPNVRLTTHEGKAVRFFDDLIKDKVVVINFMYTSCPDVCPLETAKLAELQAILGDRVGQDVFLYSITIDPATDTPPVLREYAERYGARPGWQFLTGAEDDITLLRRKLGLYIAEIEGEGSNDHNVSLLLGNQRTGRWMKRSPFENPNFLADQVGSWLHNWKTPAPNQDSYSNAPQLEAMSTGERLFSSRCAACHVIGGRDLVPASQSARLLGPDLFNVTQRRDPEWLARWLAEPDRMLAEKDPLAVELYEKHGQVAMPNFELKGADVAALIEYLDTESRRVAPYERAAAAGTGEPKGPAAACCRKGESAVLEAQAPAAGSGDDAQGGGAVTAVFVRSSLGLGCFFLALAGLVRWRFSPPGGERRPVSGGGAGATAPPTPSQEASE